MRWLTTVKTGLKYLVVGLAGLLLIGFFYQLYGLSQDGDRYPMLGQRHSVGDRELHIYCAGEGSPTVVFEAGAGGHSGWWELILKEVSKTTRACAYDRAGMGWSPYVEGALTKQQVAEHLHRLLKAQGVEGDLVMVGHSQGGIYLRQFMKLYPAHVKGLVFIDSAHEQMGIDMKRAEDHYQLEPFVPFDAMLSGLRFLNVFAQFGLTRFVVLLSSDADSVGRRIGAMYAQNHSLKAFATEIEMWRNAIYEERGPEPLGDIPLTVIVRGIYQDSPTQQQNDVWRAFWVKLQDELASLSSRSELVIAEKSDHIMMLFEQVDLCVSAIIKHVKIARDLSSAPPQSTTPPPATSARSNTDQAL